MYALYLDWAIGDAWAFTSAQADWNRNASPLGPLEGLKDAAQSAGRGLRHLFEMPAGGRRTSSASACGTSPTWRCSSPRSG